MRLTDEVKNFLRGFAARVYLLMRIATLGILMWVAWIGALAPIFVTYIRIPEIRWWQGVLIAVFIRAIRELLSMELPLMGLFWLVPSDEEEDNK